MPDRTVYLPQFIDDKYRNDPNKKGLVAKLLMAHYAVTKPGIILPTVESEKNAKFKRMLKDNEHFMQASEVKYFPVEEAA